MFVQFPSCVATRVDQFFRNCNGKCRNRLHGLGLESGPCRNTCVRLQMHTADSFGPHWSCSGPIALPAGEQGLSATPLDVAAAAAGGLRVLLMAAGVDDLRVVNVNADASGVRLLSCRCLCRYVRVDICTQWALLKWRRIESTDSTASPAIAHMRCHTAAAHPPTMACQAAGCLM